MAENILYLCPSDYHLVPHGYPKLIDTLKGDGFIADTVEVEGEVHYQPGDEFLSLITFLGCSPVISLGEPGKTGEEFCHIAIDAPLEAPRFVGGDNIKLPRCPGCGHRFEQWQALIDAWEENPESAGFTCPKCDKALTAPSLRWRKSAGFGRFFIKVWGIFESEAIPNPNLLSTLEKSTGSPWQHFYVRYS